LKFWRRLNNYERKFWKLHSTIHTALLLLTLSAHFYLPKILAKIILGIWILALILSVGTYLIIRDEYFK
jgi:hypothetical protein